MPLGHDLLGGATDDNTALPTGTGVCGMAPQPLIRFDHKFSGLPAYECTCTVILDFEVGQIWVCVICMTIT